MPQLLYTLLLLLPQCRLVLLQTLNLQITDLQDGEMQFALYVLGVSLPPLSLLLYSQWFALHTHNPRPARE